MSLETELTSLIVNRYFVDAIVLATGGTSSVSSPTAELLVGISCCGCVAPLALGQRLLDGDDVPSSLGQGPVLQIDPLLRVAEVGLTHLTSALRRRPDLALPAVLAPVAADVSDDLAYASRREVHRAPGDRVGLRPDVACLAASVLLRQLAGRSGPPPRIHPTRLAAVGPLIANLTDIDTAAVTHHDR